ncbi:MAG: putative sugar nucleotidyl transferase [Phycisphaerae bacterium]
MPPLYVFEDSQFDRLFPLTYARPAFELRCGNLTLLERLEQNLGHPIAGLFVRNALAETLRARTRLPVNPALSTKDGVLLVNARWLFLKKPNDPAWEIPFPDSAALSQTTILWIHLSPELAADIDFSKLSDPRTLEALLPRVQRTQAHGILIERPWHLLDHQRAAILEDFAHLGPANHAALLPGVHLLNQEHIHLAKGVKVWPGAVLDAQAGPILVGEDTEIRANAVITGPTSIGPHCLIRTAADIREDCSFGPNSRVGGEIMHSIFLGNANKQHHGFLGQSIVGEWANLGAGTTTSNLKNTYGLVRMPIANTDTPTNRQFLGSLIADHVKLGIGTYLSTGSVIGFASHVTIPRPPRFVPSFAWLTDEDHPIARADFEKIEQIAAIAMKRRGVEFSPADHELFVRIASEYATTENYPWPDSK